MIDEQHPTKPRKRREKLPAQPQRLEDWRIDGLNSVFPGFASWYRASHDEQGRLTVQTPGLRPVKEGE